MTAYKSPDGRIRTEVYQREGARFCLAEPTSKGTLITEFAADCQAVGQNYSVSADIMQAICSYLNEYSLEVVEVKSYSPVELKAKCSKCGNVGMIRELDRIAPKKIMEAPDPIGPPLFECKKCGQRHYSITNQFVRSFVLSNRRLFEKDELESLDGNEEATVNELREIIIRIFASKKISRAVLV